MRLHLEHPNCSARDASVFPMGDRKGHMPPYRVWQELVNAFGWPQSLRGDHLQQSRIKGITKLCMGAVLWGVSLVQVPGEEK